MEPDGGDEQAGNGSRFEGARRAPGVDRPWRRPTADREPAVTGIVDWQRSRPIGKEVDPIVMCPRR